MTCNVHGCVTVDYQQIENDNIANQIHGFTIDYGKFILIATIRYLLFAICYSGFPDASMSRFSFASHSMDWPKEGLLMA